MEEEMTDWADGIEMRNYGIKCGIDMHVLSEFVRTIVALVLVAGALLFYSWIRIQIVSTGYESQRLFLLQESLLKDQGKLILNGETLSSPERVDSIARNDLGMIPLRPNQLIAPQFRDLAQTAADAMAMADSEAALSQKAAAETHFGNYPADSDAY
jgi:cell division protein FtsL